MKEERSRRFNFQSLLRLEELDIRKMAKNNPTLTVGDYYSLLANFLNNVQLITETLNRIIANDIASNDFWSLAYIKTLLEDMGNKKYSAVIEDITKACKRGHNKFASDHAKKVLEGISNLQSQILAVEKSEDETEDPDAEEKTDELDSTQAISTFLITLDYEEATRKLRILAIDDAPVLLKTISSILSDEYKVYGMTNPALLEKFLHQVVPELFLLDYSMPELSGFDCIPIIRSFEEHKNTPIIFLTSSGTSDHVAAAFALGACDFIVKPFQANVLKEKIAKHIVRKNLF